MLTAFDVTLLIISLAGYVFLFLKLRQAEVRAAELRDRVEKILHGVERTAAAPRPTELLPAAGGAEALQVAEDARDQISAARSDLAELKAFQAHGFSVAEQRAQALQAELLSLREALSAAEARNAPLADELRRVAAKQAAAAAAEASATAEAELARKRLRMFP
jgi:hypothetical protein